MRLAQNVPNTLIHTGRHRVSIAQPGQEIAFPHAPMVGAAFNSIALLPPAMVGVLPPPPTFLFRFGLRAKVRASYGMDNQNFGVIDGYQGDVVVVPTPPLPPPPAGYQPHWYWWWTGTLESTICFTFPPDDPSIGDGWPISAGFTTANFGDLAGTPHTMGNFDTPPQPADGWRQLEGTIVWPAKVLDLGGGWPRLLDGPFGGDYPSSSVDQGGPPRYGFSATLSTPHGFAEAFSGFTTCEFDWYAAVGYCTTDAPR